MNGEISSSLVSFSAIKNHLCLNITKFDHMKYPALFLLSALCTTCFYACRDQEQIDVESPVIEAIFLDGVAVNSIEVEQGTTHTIGIQVSDNKKLESIGIETVLNSVLPTPPVGTYMLTVSNTENQEDALSEFVFTLSDSISSNLIAEITATDVNGNESQKRIGFTITNGLKPVIIGSSTPTANDTGTISLSAGENLYISGEAGDLDGLSSLRVMLWDQNNAIISASNITITGNPQAFSNASFDNAQPGQYRVVIEAIDALGYKSYWGKWVNVN